MNGEDILKEIRPLINEIELKEIEERLERLKKTNSDAIEKYYNMVRKEFICNARGMRLAEIISNPSRIRNFKYNRQRISKNVEDMIKIVRKEIEMSEEYITNHLCGRLEDNILELYREEIKLKNQFDEIHDILRVIFRKIQVLSSYGIYSINDIEIRQFIDIMEISELLRELKYHIFDVENEQLIAKHNDTVQAINQIIGIGTIDNYIKNGEEVTKVPAYERMKAFTEFAKIQVVK